MSSRLTLGAMILLPGISIAAASTLSMPDTLAGHTLGAWLDAFNSDDSARIKAFDDVHAPWLTLDRATGLREHSGGYELLSIGKSEKLWITFSAREKATATPISGTCRYISVGTWYRPTRPTNRTKIGTPTPDSGNASKPATAASRRPSTYRRTSAT
jgi:hypothetical protein